MNCSTFQRRLNEAELGRDDFILPPAWQEHLAECEKCQREWQTHNLILRGLDNDAMPLLSPLFTSQVMAKLPTGSLVKRQINFEAVLLVAAITAGLLATWFVSDGLRQSILAFITSAAWLESGRKILDAALWFWRQALMNTLGEQMLGKGLQILLITLVTVVVAKVAVMLDQRLRRMLKGF